jgi:PIN domain nuclease of toxin-antitoxin system
VTASEAFVVDTNALVFRVAGSRKLGSAARRVFERHDAGAVALYVPAPALAELTALGRRGTIQLQGSFRRWWGLLQAGGMIGLPLTIDDVLLARELEWDHTDWSDRLIVATALRLDLPLVTADRAIAEWGGIEVIW